MNTRHEHDSHSHPTSSPETPPRRLLSSVLGEPLLPLAASVLFAFRCGQAVAAGPTFPSYASSPPSRLGTGAHPGTSIDRCPVSCGKKERKVLPRRSKERKKTADCAKLTDGSGMAEKVTESGPRSSPLFLLSCDRQSRGHTAEGDF